MSHWIDEKKKHTQTKNNKSMLTINIFSINKKILDA